MTATTSLPDSSVLASSLCQKVRTELDYSSGIRRGKVNKLPLGTVAIYENDSHYLASNSDKKINFYPPGRILVGTFILCQTYSLKHNELANGRYDVINNFFDTVTKKFTAYETKEVVGILQGGDQVVYSDKVKQLQEFFNNLGRPVAVLPTGKVLSVTDENFQLVIRNDLDVTFRDNPSKMTINFTLWEDVGFLYELKEGYV